MAKKQKLSKTMSEAEFDNGYWYAVELKAFANEIGIPASSKLRKDELEKSIKQYLRTGQTTRGPRQKASVSRVKDLDKGLNLKLEIINYTSNKATKNFIQREALKMAPLLQKKSGAWYWLNRWREEQLAKSIKITYADLVKQYIQLNQKKGGFPRIPSTRFNNFISDFLAAEKGTTRRQAIQAWERLKKMDIPKTYEAWKRFTTKAQ